MSEKKPDKGRRSVKMDAGPLPPMQDGDKMEAEGLEGLVLLGRLKTQEDGYHSAEEDAHSQLQVEEEAREGLPKRRKKANGEYSPSSPMMPSTKSGLKPLQGASPAKVTSKFGVKKAKVDGGGKLSHKTMTQDGKKLVLKLKDKAAAGEKTARPPSAAMVGTTRIKGEILVSFCNWGAGEGISSGRHAIQRLLDIVSMSKEELNREKLKPRAKPVQMLLNRQQVVNVRGPPGVALWNWAVSAGMVERPSADIVEALFNDAMKRLENAGIPTNISSSGNHREAVPSSNELRTPVDLLEANGFCRKTRTTRHRPAAMDHVLPFDIISPPEDGGGAFKGPGKENQAGRFARTNLMTKIGEKDQLPDDVKLQSRDMEVQTQELEFASSEDILELDLLVDRVKRKRKTLEEEERRLDEAAELLAHQRRVIAMEIEELLKRRKDACEKVTELERVAASHPAVCTYGIMEVNPAIAHGEGG